MLARQEGREFLNDHLLADGAEGAAEVSHAAVKLRAVHTAVKIVGPFEESDRPHRNRRRLRITVRTVCITRRRHGCRRLD